VDRCPSQQVDDIYDIVDEWLDLIVYLYYRIVMVAFVVLLVLLVHIAIAPLVAHRIRVAVGVVGVDVVEGPCRRRVGRWN
jgi:hypothetical protein